MRKINKTTKAQIFFFFCTFFLNFFFFLAVILLQFYSTRLLLYCNFKIKNEKSVFFFLSFSIKYTAKGAALKMTNCCCLCFFFLLLFLVHLFFSSSLMVTTLNKMFKTYGNKKKRINFFFSC